jgi:hypothetical protein
MNDEQQRAMTDTHLDDLQSEMEAGRRRIERIAVDADEIRAALFQRHLKQAELVGKLARRANALRKAVTTQCTAVRSLRLQVQAEREARARHR